jgi:arginase
MSRVAIIGVPSSAGARSKGQEHAPQLFRQAGLIDRLRDVGLDVVDLGDLPMVSYEPDPDHPKEQNLPFVSAVARQVADRVEKCVRAGMKPVVLGGDCTITLGVLAGLLRHQATLGLMYFDGDVDLNTPSSTLSGIFDGMVMAHILGEGADELTHIGPRNPLMPEESIVLFGYNPQSGWIDAAEIEHLEHSQMVQYPVSQIRGRALDVAREALARLEEKEEQLLVHFDIDVIDFADFPAADTPHEHGLIFREAMEALQVFLSSPQFAGLVITEFNANRDPDSALAGRFVEALASALDAGHRKWQEVGGSN